ncbi:hypothetical protein [Dactylosporangium sp. NPDC051541]|uniref:hypothetical protein n=1 Tax=Dactylosporangium sp. NPDC051541 TaxID=3363977 RepID=UPI0037B7AFCE
MVEEFRRVHQEQRDWGLRKRHEARLRQIYGDNVPVTTEEWLEARAARPARLADAPEQAQSRERARPPEQAQPLEELEEPTPAPDADGAEDARAAEPAEVAAPEGIERSRPWIRLMCAASRSRSAGAGHRVFVGYRAHGPPGSGRHAPAGGAPQCELGRWELPE